MPMIRRSVVTLALAMSAAPLTPAAAQIRASELQTIAQVVDGTSIKLTYSRPRLRGRTNVWGTRVVNWDEVWTPGANEATILETNRDVTISGVAVPKGKYSVWMIVSKDTTWTMLLDPKWKQYHTDHPKPNDTMIRVPVKATLSAPTVEEALTWTFPSVTARGGSIAMQWERTRVTMPFAVTPTLSELLPEAEARPYVGTYALTDAKTKKVEGKMIVTYERGGLKATFEPYVRAPEGSAELFHGRTVHERRGLRRRRDLRGDAPGFHDHVRQQRRTDDTRSTRCRRRCVFHGRQAAVTARALNEYAPSPNRACERARHADS